MPPPLPSSKAPAPHTGPLDSSTTGHSALGWLWRFPHSGLRLVPESASALKSCPENAQTPGLPLSSSSGADALSAHKDARSLQLKCSACSRGLENKPALPKQMGLIDPSNGKCCQQAVGSKRPSKHLLNSLCPAPSCPGYYMLQAKYWYPKPSPFLP